MRVKNPAKCAQLCELQQFNEANLQAAGGFARHRESSKDSRMGLVVDVHLALQAISAWGSEMIESVVIQRPEAFEMGGVEIEAPETEVVAREMTDVQDEDDEENVEEKAGLKNGKENRKRKPVKKSGKKAKKAKKQE